MNSVFNSDLKRKGSFIEKCNLIDRGLNGKKGGGH